MKHLSFLFYIIAILIVFPSLPTYCREPETHETDIDKVAMDMPSHITGHDRIFEVKTAGISEEPAMKCPKYKNVNALMKHYRWNKGVIQFGIGNFILNMVSIFVNDEDLKTILQYVNRVDILVMEDSGKEKELFKDVDLQMQLYEKAVEVKDEGDKVTIYMKADDDMINELVVFVCDREDGDVVLLDLHGKIEVSKLMEIISEDSLKESIAI